MIYMIKFQNRVICSWEVYIFTSALFKIDAFSHIYNITKNII